MKERKDKIKNVAIIFLIIMLLLTFFSNTIMNYSLVEVSTQMVSNGKITSKVRGSGTVEASETYAVTISESRKIATVEVKTGDTVQTGDTLFTLEDAKSSELQEAEKSLASLKKDYETAALQSGLTISELEAIEQGTTTSLKDKMNQLSSLQAAVDNAEAAVTAAQTKVNDLEAKKTEAESATVDTSAEQKALNDATAAQTSAENKVELLTIDVESNKFYSYTDEQIAALKGDDKKAYKKFVALKDDLTKAKKDLENCKTAVTQATAALESKKESGDSSNTSQVNSINNQLTLANQELTAAQKAQEDAEAALKEISEGQVTEVTLASQYSDILEQQKVVDDLQDKSIDAVITSPISGTITEIAYTAGQTVAADEAIAQIQPENKAFTLSFTATANQAKKLKVGDKAEILNNWYGANISAQVSSIRRDPQDKQNCTIVCTMSGDVSSGDSYTLSVGEQSANYDYIVPTSAIREDSNGKFILTIRAKSTPLGNRYYAQRVDVEVITSDDSQSAVSGALDSYGVYVITTTTKPVEAGQQVRLANEQE
uniref:HlyD family efflux transporter periplasmic adaptor subunit n=1 Tax=Roseburia sp. TaxID=2049040 RepID=UPI003FEE60F7